MSKNNRPPFTVTLVTKTSRPNCHCFLIHLPTVHSVWSTGQCSRCSRDWLWIFPAIKLHDLTVACRCTSLWPCIDMYINSKCVHIYPITRCTQIHNHRPPAKNARLCLTSGYPVFSEDPQIQNHIYHKYVTFIYIYVYIFTLYIYIHTLCTYIYIYEHNMCSTSSWLSGFGVAWSKRRKDVVSANLCVFSETCPGLLPRAQLKFS